MIPDNPRPGNRHVPHLKNQNHRPCKAPNQSSSYRHHISCFATLTRSKPQFVLKGKILRILRIHLAGNKLSSSTLTVKFSIFYDYCSPGNRHNRHPLNLHSIEKTIIHVIVQHPCGQRHRLLHIYYSDIRIASRGKYTLLRITAVKFRNIRTNKRTYLLDRQTAFIHSFGK